MRKLLLLAIASLSPVHADEAKPPVSCTKAGVCQLHGKVKFVTAFPKYKIKIVNAFPDIKVKKVNAFPDKPGEWQVVDAFPDFTVQIVDAFPDFTVQYVDAFPGCN
jgi:hypothetical protein